MYYEIHKSHNNQNKVVKAKQVYVFNRYLQEN